jgi:hypothetical protein
MARVELEMARLASDPRTASAVAVIDYPVGVNMCHALLVDTPSLCHCVQWNLLLWNARGTVGWCCATLVA